MSKTSEIEGVLDSNNALGSIMFTVGCGGTGAVEEGLDVVNDGEHGSYELRGGGEFYAALTDHQVDFMRKHGMLEDGRTTEYFATLITHLETIQKLREL